ncbi:hypothetical protein REPUB_Repub14bG0049000 [Reevesia pubescens]
MGLSSKAASEAPKQSKPSNPSNRPNETLHHQRQQIPNSLLSPASSNPTSLPPYTNSYGKTNVPSPSMCSPPSDQNTRLPTCLCMLMLSPRWPEPYDGRD